MQLGIRKAVLQGYYYFYDTQTELLMGDRDVAKVMDMGLTQFQTLLKEKFNAKYSRLLSELVFYTENDACEALDYLNSILTFKKIAAAN